GVSGSLDLPSDQHWPADSQSPSAETVRRSSGVAANDSSTSFRSHSHAVPCHSSEPRNPRGVTWRLPMTNPAGRTKLSFSTAPSRGRTIAYWITTLVLGAEGIVGGILGLARWAPYVAIIRHLGYPTYLMPIISVWYMVAGLVVLVPRFPRVKEWAYSGL